MNPLHKHKVISVGKEIHIQILNGREILVTSNRENQIFSVSHGTKSNWVLDWIWIPRHLALQIQNWDFCWIGICSWLKSPHHSGFRFAFLSSFRVSSSRERAVVRVIGLEVGFNFLSPTRIFYEDTCHFDSIICMVCPRVWAKARCCSAPFESDGFGPFRNFQELEKRWQKTTKSCTVT